MLIKLSGSPYTALCRGTWNSKAKYTVRRKRAVLPCGDGSPEHADYILVGDIPIRLPEGDVNKCLSDLRMEVSRGSACTKCQEKNNCPFRKYASEVREQVCPFLYLHLIYSTDPVIVTLIKKKPRPGCTQVEA